MSFLDFCSFVNLSSGNTRMFYINKQYTRLITLTEWRTKPIYMVISKDTEKVFEKIWYPFITQKHSTNEVLKESTSLHLRTYITNLLLMSFWTEKKLKAFLLPYGKSQGCPLLPILLNILLDILAKKLGRRKK
jgi:hypothetical protein